jgi:uncharacterized protein
VRGETGLKSLQLISAGIRLLATVCLAAVLLVGCAERSSGFAAYKRGDYPTALREFQAEGSPDGNFAIGLLYYKGEGVKRDMREAASFFRKAADHGHAGARNNLGLMHAQGSGVPRDYRKAARWYRMAAEQGYDKAQFNLGLLYAHGDGVERNRREALHWLALSARQGNPCAMKQLKLMIVENR